MPHSEPLLEAVDLAHLYAREGLTIHLLQSINLRLLSAQVVAVLGANGSGKSTLLRLLAGLEKPTAGILTSTRPDLTRGMVFQQDDQNLLPWLNVRDNVALSLRLRRVSVVARRQVAQAALQRIGIEDLASRLPVTLSGGQRQLVTLARWVASPPDVLFLDEATAMLDFQQRHNADVIIRDLADTKGVAVLVATHSIDEAACLADRVLLLLGAPQAPCLQEIPFSKELEVRERAAAIRAELSQ